MAICVYANRDRCVGKRLFTHCPNRYFKRVKDSLTTFDRKFVKNFELIFGKSVKYWLERMFPDLSEVFPSGSKLSIHPLGHSRTGENKIVSL